MDDIRIEMIVSINGGDEISTYDTVQRATEILNRCLEDLKNLGVEVVAKLHSGEKVSGG